MLKGFVGNEVKLLSIISRLAVTGRQPTEESILRIIEIKVPDISDCWEEAANSLLNKEIIFCKTNNENMKVYSLTEYGKTYIDEIEKNNYLTLFFYNAFYKRAESSKAHSEFCKRVYGQDFCQHGMLDMHQQHKLIEAANLGKDSHVLELGCGNGFITEYMSDITKSHITGIDIAVEAITSANNRTTGKRDRLVFDAKSMDDLDYPDDSFDAVISIDTLYYVGNMESTIRSINRVLKPRGSMLVFYHVPPDVGIIPGSDPAKCSNLGRVLDSMHLVYETIDFSNENSKHWELKKQVLQELKEAFEAESNLFLYNNRMEECRGNLGEFYRFLYIIQNNK